MIRCWITPEELTMYRLQGYVINMPDRVTGPRNLIECVRLLECTLDGKRHRLDGPSVIYPDGTMCWYQYGKRHRDDGPAQCRPDGDMVWYQHDKLHRDDAPAFVHLDGDMVWFQNGNRHREDGPALINSDGSLEWWLDGSEYQTREDWLAELERRRGS